MNTHDTHLSERAIEALACGRDDLASDAERDHATRCDRCTGNVVATRELADSTRAQLSRAVPEPSALQLDRWVSAALAADAAVSGQRAASPSLRRPIPSRPSLWAAAVALGLVAAGTLTRDLTGMFGSVRLVREAGIAGVALTEVLLGMVPGGRLGVVVAGMLFLSGCMMLLKRIAADGGELSSAARRMFGMGLFTLVATLFGGVGLPKAHALDFQGEWDSAARPVTLTVERAAASDVLRQAATAAGVNLVATLPEDPQVTLAVNELPLREVIAAVLGDAPLVAKLTGSVLVIRAASAAPAAAAPLPGPVPVMPPTAAAKPAFPPPPAPPRSLGLDEDRDTDEDRPRKKGKARDVVTMGSDVVVARGERAKDVVTMGGDADIAGEVTGDVVTMGGAIHVRNGASVRGDLVTFGGDVTIEDGAIVEGARVGFDHGRKEMKKWANDWKDEAEDWGPDWMGDTLGSVAHYALLFLLGLMLLSLVPDRLSAVERTVARAPGRSLALGFIGFLTVLVMIVVLAISIIGLPAALALLIGLPIAVYFGLAAIAAVLGAAIPIERVQRSPIAQLAVGVGILFLISLVPFIGWVVLIVAAAVGLGAVLLTRLSKRAFGDLADV